MAGFDEVFDGIKAVAKAGAEFPWLDNFCRLALWKPATDPEHYESAVCVSPASGKLTYGLKYKDCCSVQVLIKPGKTIDGVLRELQVAADEIRDHHENNERQRAATEARRREPSAN